MMTRQTIPTSSSAVPAVVLLVAITAFTTVPRALLSGPMFQAVLVERFGLKVRRETRVVRAYVLTPAPRGVTVATLREYGSSPVRPRATSSSSNQSSGRSRIERLCVSTS